MERLNKIFAEWAKQDKKTELASEKIELAIIDDLRKQYATSEARMLELRDYLGQFKQIEQKAKSAEKEFRKTFNKFTSTNDKGKKMAQDLGLDWQYDSKYQELYKRSGDILTEYKKIFGSI